MPVSCVAGFCSNTHADGFSLHKFPRDPVRRQQWVQQVRRTRDKWTPTEQSRLCSAHFEEGCFDTLPALKEQLGFAVHRKRVLLPTAVPSIFPRPRHGVGLGDQGPGQRSETEARDKRPAGGRVSTAVLKRARLETLAKALEHAEEAGTQEATDTNPPDLAELEPPFVDPVKVEASCQASLRPSCRTVGTQFSGFPRLRKSFGVQTTDVREMVTVCTQTPGPLLPEPEDYYSDGDTWNPSDSDTEYAPSDGSFDSEDLDSGTDGAKIDPPTDSAPSKVYLVFWASLLQLITLWCSCPSCGCRQLSWATTETGTMLTLELKCTDTGCGYSGHWNSQPYLGKMAAGNINLSAAILFAGASATKVLRVLSHMGVAVFSIRTYFRHQHQVLNQAIQSLWRERQVWMLSLLQAEGEDVVCGGDGRADSPGHSAKYGTYTMMELRKRAILDVQIVQSNEVGGSYHMEQEGLIRSLGVLEEYVVVGTLVTDRHVSINKMVRQQYPRIQHLFDIWHVGKGIKKKLKSLAKNRGFEPLKPWIGSIVNHLYWSVVSTPAGNPTLVVDKWLSVLSHVQNIHSGFQGSFPRCSHGRLSRRERKKPWLTPHTKVTLALEKIVTNANLLKGIGRLSPVYQTSDLEAFHSLVNHFAPKMFAFSYEGMVSRTLLAALHFNENAHRAHSVTREGVAMYSVQFPKSKQGAHTVRKILESPTFVYVRDLMEIVEVLCREGDLDGEDDLPNQPERERQPLSSDCRRPDKQEAIQTHVSRFPAE